MFYNKIRLKVKKKLQ